MKQKKPKEFSGNLPKGYARPRGISQCAVNGMAYPLLCPEHCTKGSSGYEFERICLSPRRPRKSRCVPGGLKKGKKHY